MRTSSHAWRGGDHVAFWHRSIRHRANGGSDPRSRQTGRTGLRLPGSEACMSGRQTQLTNIGNTLHDRPMEIRPQATPATVGEAGDTSHCERKERRMRLGQTNPMSTPTRIGGRQLRGALAGSIASKWRNKANPGRNLRDRRCGVRAGAASTDSLLAKQSHRVPVRPCGTPPPTPVWGKIYKTN